MEDYLSRRMEELVDVAEKAAQSTYSRPTCKWRGQSCPMLRAITRAPPMAKSRKQSGIDVDWYLISIDRLKQIGLVVLLVLLAAAGWWSWHNQKGNPKSNAESAIEIGRASCRERV